jgi:hypothetical protein
LDVVEISFLSDRKILPYGSGRNNCIFEKKQFLSRKAVFCAGVSVAGLASESLPVSVIHCPILAKKIAFFVGNEYTIVVWKE